MRKHIRQLFAAANGSYCFLLTLLFSAGAVVAAPLTWPIQIKESKVYDDGGTRAYIAIDSKNQPFVFCLDRRLMTSTPDAFYLSVSHPHEKGAALLMKGSRAEKEFVNKVKSSLHAQFGLNREKEILKRYREKDRGLSELEIGIGVLLSKIGER